MSIKNRNDNMDGYDSLLESMKGFAEQMKRFADMAVIQYTPWVNDICSRTATQKEVEHLFDYMSDFLGDERMLQLFKQVCRHYIYPDTVDFYIMEYRKEYDPESLKGTEYDHLLNKEDLENEED